MLQGVKKQSNYFHLVHPGSSGKALRKTWYLKWLMQMSRILVVERKGRGGQGYAQETEDIEQKVADLDQNMKRNWKIGRIALHKISKRLYS